jgi:hypothetical protein
LAWPASAKLNICCEEPAGKDASTPCTVPTYSLPQESGELEIAPHFFTQLFEQGQQESLTAALIAKINVHGKKLLMDVEVRA